MYENYDYDYNEAAYEKEMEERSKKKKYNNFDVLTGVMLLYLGQCILFSILRFIYTQKSPDFNDVASSLLHWDLIFYSFPLLVRLVLARKPLSRGQSLIIAIANFIIAPIIVYPGALWTLQFMIMCTFELVVSFFILHFGYDENAKK